MLLKIKKMVLGEEYIFRVTIEPNNFECKFRIQGMETIHEGVICPNLKCIAFKMPIQLKGYIDGDSSSAPKKNVLGLMLSKENQYKVKDYIQIIKD